MKSYFKYITALSLATLAFGAISCQDDFDAPVIKAPEATLEPNMSILQLKKQFWDDATNYIDTIGVENGVPDDKKYVIAGRVVSSDEAGNVFKSLVIQDDSAAIALSINSYNLYLKYRVGQEIVIDLKGMYIGKYNGLVQLGMPEWYDNGNAWEATFMAPEFFEQHIQLNGFPEAAKIDTLEINSFSELPSNPEGLMKWQSRLVKFNNVYFQNAGIEQFSEYHSSGVNQNIVDVNNNTLPVRTSGYSNFWNKYLPKGNGDVVCILSYYGTGWQLLLNDYEGCMNFGNPTLAPGTETKPYTVMDAIATIQESKKTSGWVSGYIVGAVAPEVTSVKSNDDIEWSKDVALANTLVIGATPETKDISQALVISLPQGSKLRQYGNLVDNPGNFQKAISVTGSFGYYMDTYGITDNNGSADQFKIEGVTIEDTENIQPGDGTEDKPYNAAQVIAMNPQGKQDSPDKTDVWVAGYIVGWADMSSTYYINAETSKFSTPATMATNILLADTPDVTDYSKCIGVQLPSGDVRSALNLVDHPENLGRGVKLYGNISKYSGVPGVTKSTKYAWLDGSSGTTSGGNDKPDTPVTPTTGNSADFSTLNGGVANTMNYGTYTTANGWSTEWALVLAGGTDATNFISTDASFLFPCIDGTPKRPGKLFSPTIAGGIKTLKFNYGFPYNEKKVGFTVNIKQNGAVVASQTVIVDPANKGVINEFSYDFNISGDFVIEIVNDCVTQSTNNNGDRIAIWNLTWTN